MSHRVTCNESEATKKPMHACSDPSTTSHTDIHTDILYHTYQETTSIRFTHAI